MNRKEQRKEGQLRGGQNRYQVEIYYPIPRPPHHSRAWVHRKDCTGTLRHGEFARLLARPGVCFLPHLACTIYGTADAEVGGVIELSARDFSMMPHQGVHASSRSHIPNCEDTHPHEALGLYLPCTPPGR